MEYWVLFAACAIATTIVAISDQITEGFIPIVMFATVAISLWVSLLLFVGGSLGISTVKAISDKCGHHYPLEDYFHMSGNWFCGSKEKL